MQPAPPMEEDYGLTVSLLRSTIQKYFIVNDVRFDSQAYAFFVQVDERTLEQAFDDMRRELLDLGFVPNLLKERPGYVIYIVRMPERQFRGIKVNVVMLALTILSTIGAGMLFVTSYEDLPFWTWETAGKGALYFALPLMLILGLHEMGHYLAARRHRVAASLPFFIPAPPYPFLIGTFGAFISLREPIQSKRSLMDIGFAGPIAGFIVAIFVTLLGFALSSWDPHFVGDDESATIILGTPLIFDALSYLVPTPDDVLIHPTAFAGWVGFLVTFLNLLPAGQLDGGHIIRALFGQYARIVGYATIVGMVIVSFVTGYFGWVLFIALMVLFMNHPPPLNDISPLPPSRYIYGVGAIVMLVICFVPAPFQLAELEPEVDPFFDQPEVHVLPGDWANNTLVLVNVGNTVVDAQVRIDDTDGWGFEFQEGMRFTDGFEEWSEPFLVSKNRSTNFTTYVNFSMTPQANASLGERYDFVFEIRYTDPQGTTRLIDTRYRAVVGWVEPRFVPEDGDIPVDWVTSYTVRFKNLVTDRDNQTTRFDLALDVEGDLWNTLTDASVSDLTPEEVDSRPPLTHVDLSNNGTAELLIWIYAPPGTEEVSGLRVDLWVARAGVPTSAIPLGFQLDVGTIDYDVTISSPSTRWSFAPDGEKNVTFNLTSHGNVDTMVTISYEMTGPDAFEFSEDPLDTMTLSPGETQVLTVRLFATGDVDDEVSLKVEIEYGNLQASSVSTTLAIESG
ncbi:MAG: site-2 protease family protein [Thermoplasmata archaeon]|nr:MAG: site-2 protease family protein [Thermoplasmata archaeon]